MNPRRQRHHLSKRPHTARNSEALFYEFRNEGAMMKEILQFARVRAKVAEKQSLFE